MCNKVATPFSDELQGFFDKQAPLMTRIFKIAPYEHYYQADFFNRPFLPVLANDTDTVRPARWKLLPYWVRNEDEAKKYANTGNARSEEIFEKASYKPYVLKCHCLLFVSGFFEPNHPAKKVTVPYFIRARDGQPLALGCLYADWTDKDTGEVTRTFTIITTPPNQLLSEIHNEGQRMPLILTPDKWDAWLNPAITRETTISLMQPLPDGLLEGYPVSGIIYKQRTLNTPEVQQPVAP